MKADAQAPKQTVISLPLVRNPPDSVADVIGNEKTAVLRLDKADRPTHHARRRVPRGPKAECEIVIAARRLAVAERHIDDLVAARIGGVPRSVSRHERTAP